VPLLLLSSIPSAWLYLLQQPHLTQLFQHLLRAEYLHPAPWPASHGLWVLLSGCGTRWPTWTRPCGHHIPSGASGSTGYECS
uniref:Uncharacterized protein n=1 Tax=Scleropages formosus TaxID=113540 RepID=A0A8C9RM57_SCLFO